MPFGVTMDLVTQKREVESSVSMEAPDMGGSYRDLRVWQNAMKLVTNIYQETQKFPREEVYGLISQMRRAAVSVPSNIAEGKGRLTDRDRAHFFSQARGSLLELETQILIARELGFLSEAGAETLTTSSAELGRMLNALVGSIRPKFEKTTT
jgi:four helix bundle protein